MNIRKKREEKGITQRELARRIGVDVSVISRYENGTITPPANRMEEMAYALEIPVNELYGDDINLQPDKKTSGSVLNAQREQRLLHYAKMIRDLYLNDENTCEVNEIVKDTLIKNSMGVCELCGKKAPFKDRDGKPYLEPHRLPDNGKDDSVYNTVLLCPNCHRKMHVLKLEEDSKKLLMIAKGRRK